MKQVLGNLFYCVFLYCCISTSPFLLFNEWWKNVKPCQNNALVLFFCHHYYCYCC